MLPSSGRTRVAAAGPTGATVNTFITSLIYPLKAQPAAGRAIICPAAPGIAEEITWNSPSLGSHVRAELLLNRTTPKFRSGG